MIFGPEKKEFSGGCRKLHSEEFHNLYSLPNSNRMAKSRMTRAEHVVRMGVKRYKFTGKALMWESLNVEVHLEDLSIDGRIIFK
jgi:hypothetical protein